MMGKRTNPAVIGGFIVGAVVLIIVGILVFSRGQFLSDKRVFVLFFEGSVKGLNIGAPVDFQGVQIGSVTDIRLHYLAKDHEFRTPVFIELEPARISEVDVRDATVDAEIKERRLFKTLIERGLRAQLATQSLVTGQLFIQMVFRPDTPVRLVGGVSEAPELPTIPTTMQQATQEAQELLKKLGELPLDQLFANVLGITEGLNRLVNAPETQGLVQALSGTTTELQELARHLNGGVGRLLDDIGGISKAAGSLVTDAQQLVRRVDGQVVPLSTNVKETLDVTRGAVKDTQQLIRQVDSRIGRLMDGITETTKVAQATLTHTQRTVVDDKLASALIEFTAAVRSFRLLADYIERNPNALLYGKGGDRR
jgi:paraquat-inducible protein B